MKSNAAALLLLLLASAPAVHAQQAGANLNETQLLGRQVFAQSCGICHLQAVRNTKTYGPTLDKTAASGSDELMRAFIVNGSDRMPSFKHYLKAAEIDAVIAYLRTVPAPAAPAPNEPPKGGTR